jgi:uncharacterized protein (TIGR00369 family)
MTERQPSSRSCFVCGRDNPFGLRMVWENHREEGEIRSSVTVPEEFNGYPGVVHGGILAAMLDETAGRAILLDGDPDDLMVTAKMDVMYRRPTPTGTPLLVVGRVVERSERRAETKAEIRLPDGSVSARATVWLARPPKAIREGWEAERPYFRVDPPESS